MNSKENFDNNKKFSVLDTFRAFFLLVIITVAVSLLFNIVVEIIASVKKVDIEEIQGSIAYGVASPIISGLIFIIFFFVYNKCVKVKNKVAISDGNPVSLLPISIAMVLAIICIFLLSPFFDLLDYLFKVPETPLPLFEFVKSSFPAFLIGIVLYAIIPAIGEELVFRGIILRGLSSKFNGFVSIFVSGLLFALVHGSLQQTFYQLLMGILLGYLAYVGGSLVYSVILHFLNNTLVLLFGCFDIVGYLTQKAIYYNIFSMLFPILLFLLGLFLIAILMWVLRYLRNKNFFRYVPKKKRKAQKELEIPVRVGFKGFIKEISYTEKMYMIGGLAISLLIWLVNTVTMFAG